MTFQHLFYIPTIFLLGLIFGILLSNNTSTASVEGKMSGKKLGLVFLIFIIVFIITHSFNVPAGSKQVSMLLGGLEIFDKKPIFGSDAVYHNMQSFTEIGIQIYKRFTYTIDVIFPLSMLLFLYTFSRFTLQRVALTKYFFKTVKLIPLIWFGFDMLENATVFYLLSGFPKQYPLVAGSLAWITVAKFALLFLSLLVPASLLLFVKKLKHQS
ncbi:hypothetical protein HZQ44_06870 [Elizabethkingia anophelis]|nr:hypothetical protein [Elizabethkingia anophelis]MCT3694959.1 hypothetical protein [Elizabethkingia anophelis]MCT3858875.1 hypothetical protein [Elizabethkingia anophelis]MCT3912002.1 hypothetical protein [Elizabethkingia anophelis]MCT4311253.1 hypothetical protein [Elizabethkingia anophelis]